eukprot:470604_1
MFTFVQFWEYTNQRIRYNESIQPLEDITNLSLTDLKKYPPQQCALPKTPTFGPASHSRHMDRRNALRRYHSPALLRLSKTKQRDYLETLSKFVHKKYQKLTQKKQYEDDEDDWLHSRDDIPHFSLCSADPILNPQKRKNRLRRKDGVVKWKGDEAKRLKVCISALMQMRFHDQLAYSAAMAISIWTGLCYLTPLLSAFCADAKWGRATTLIIAQYVFAVGMFCIAISTYFGVEYYSMTHGLFWFGMVIVGVGFGGFKPTLSPLGADQFDAKHKTNAQKQIAKEKRSSFFGWLYWANQVGAIFASSVIAYICQNIDFSIGWSLASIALIFAIASYYSAKNYFICVPPEGSVFFNFVKVACRSCRNKCRRMEPPPLHTCTLSVSTRLSESVSPMKRSKHSPPHTPGSLISSSACYTPQKASILDWNKRCNGGDFDAIFVEDIKTALSALPALIPFPIAYIIYTNLLTLVYSQGCQMNVQMGRSGRFVLPISSLSLISTITIIIFVPATERYLYPAMNERGGCFRVTPLKKMAVAFTTAIIAMLVSAATEMIRKSSYVYQFTQSEMSSPCGEGLPVSDMSILWQSPQFFLLGMSRVLINTGAQDFFYTEAPKSMKSTLFSLNYAVDGFGAVCGSASIILVNRVPTHPWITNNLNDGHLEYYFFAIAAIMSIAFAFFISFANGYTYKEFKRLKRGKTLRGK